MAPRRKSSFELKAACARAGRIRSREKQEFIILAKPGVKEYLDSVRSEHDTFTARCTPGEPIPRQLDGSKFDWDRDHFLTQARDCAAEFLDDDRWTDWHDEYADFLARLQGGPSFVDPVAADSAHKLIQAFAPDKFVLWNATLFRLVDYFASKQADGTYLCTNRAEMGFQDEIGPILDQANEVLRAANLPFLIR